MKTIETLTSIFLVLFLKKKRLIFSAALIYVILVLKTGVYSIMDLAQTRFLSTWLLHDPYWPYPGPF